MSWLAELAVFVLCPRIPALRPLPIATGTARFLHRWSVAIAAIGTVGLLAAAALDELGFAPELAEAPPRRVARRSRTPVPRPHAGDHQ